MSVSKSHKMIRIASIAALGFLAISFGVTDASSSDSSPQIAPASTTSAPATTTTVVTPTTLDAQKAKLLAEAKIQHQESVILTKTYKMGEYSTAVKKLQGVLKIKADGFYWTKTRKAHIAELGSRGLPTSNVPAVITSQKTFEASCAKWETLARSVGFPAKEISTLKFVIWRESRCNPGAWNQKDPGTGSRGLTQINSFWCSSNSYSKTGFLEEKGILNSCEDLFNPMTSLKATLAIWKHSGWSPWGM